jgi:capsular exopolysaccharide synthesis family protein
MDKGTAAIPGEGKTTTATNVAISLARGGKSVILVDTDLRKPALHKIFELDNSRGLTNAILGNAPFGDLLQPTIVETLRVLTSGPLPPDPSLVLRSHAMHSAIQTLSNMADVVIFDSPPVMAVTDPIVLATQMNSVVVVLDARRARKQTVKQATQSLKQAGTPIAGVIFNKVSTKGTGYYHSYYYYYSSEDGLDEENSRPTRALGVLSRTFRRLIRRTESAAERERTEG